MTTTKDANAGLEALGRSIDGDVVLPADSSWDEARKAWNLAVDQRPTAVALPQSAQDVIAVVRAARELGLRVAPQATGHNAAPIGSLEDTVLLKGERMTAVQIDAGEQRARIEPGAIWGQVSDPAAEHGLAGLAGSAPNVGVMGYTLGGGLSWLGRKLGLACNSVLAAEVVTADGELVRADRDSEPDLFWALRGGGGSFGAVTALEFTLYPVPELYAGDLLWPLERAGEVLHRWHEWVDTVPDEVTSVGRVLNVPPLPEIPEQLRSRSFAMVEAAFLGSESDGVDLMAPLRELGPEIDTFGVIPPPALAGLHMDPPEPVPALGNGKMLSKLTPDTLDALLETAADADSPLLSVEMRHLGGTLAQAAPDHGALASLDGAFCTYAVGMVMAPEMVDPIEDRIAAVEKALAPCYGGSDYMNFIERPVEAASLFSPAIHGRLQQVKAQYDPDDVFCSNHPIAPAG